MPSFDYFELDRNVKKCDGEENLKNDLGILSFVLGGISSVAGLFSLTQFSWPSNMISIISTVISLVLWVPSAVLTFLATSDPFSYITGNLVNLGSLIITLYGGLGIITGTADIIISTLDEVLGIVGLIISMLTTYPEMYIELKEVFQDWFGREAVDAWLAGYGCGGYGSNGLSTFVRQVVVGL